MPNACFRCKAGIPSGNTFCDSCRRTVSLDLSYTQNSRLWVAIAAVPILQVLALAGSTVAGGGPLAGSVLLFPLGIAFAYALYRDAGHVRRRDDTDWNPSEWGYAALAVFSVLLPVLPLLVAPYHLYRRNRTIGLHLDRSA